MGRVVKILLWLVGGFVTLFILAAAALYVFFDPNDFREEISSSVKNQTGRDLTIEGEISLDIFPWLAVEVGKASLGNAPGFGDEPLAAFERASFSVRLLPAILHQEVVVGSADIEGLSLNLQVNRHGASNWSDLVPEESLDEPDVPAEMPADSSDSINVNSIEVIDATIRYADDESGETIVVDGLNLRIGHLRGDGSAIPLNAALSLDMQPAGIKGTFDVESVIAYDVESGLLALDDLAIDGTIEGLASIPTSFALNTDGIEISTSDSQISLQVIDVSMLDMHILADVQAFSYEDNVTPKATVTVDAFSPRSLMHLFDVDAPETSDPSALSSLSIDAAVEMTAAAFELSNVSIKLDDTTFTGTLSVPSTATGSYRFELVGDSIDLARYMEVSDEEGDASDEAAPIEIPVDIIEPLNARGKLKLATASLGNIIFENIDVGVNSSNGRMRVFPISSRLFGGSYSGDVRIDVSGAAPALSMNEKISGVDLAQLAKAMFDQENVTGTIEGSFVLAGRGSNMATIQKDLSGDVSMTLNEGSYTGTDVWYEIRRARALVKGEAPPEAALPAKTDFSTMRMTGVVTDGIMRSDDFYAELPFMQLTGDGQVDIPEGTVDFGMMARILERPEFLRDASPEELDEFTEAVIPLKIEGPLVSPSISPDLEKLLRRQVEDEIKDKLKDKLKGLFD